MTPAARRAAAGLLLATMATMAGAQQSGGTAVTDGTATLSSAATLAPTPPATTENASHHLTRNGRDIYASFRAGLADPNCSAETGARWQRHFAHAPHQLVSRESDALALFGYVVDALRNADLPTEYALIPFVESGFKPGARSAAGPAGLWQFIAMTARNHDIPIRRGYDGRLSAVDSTQAAVRYLKTLHGMFAGDWRLAVMAFNAGEYRVLDALKRSGQRADSATPAELVGLSGTTRSYVRKLHALSCVLDRADDREQWMHALDRPVSDLVAMPVPAGIDSLDALATRQGFD
ncbi:MAG: lytic transglycosylase domain-containing protein, partial [Luteimonas sp.]